MAMINIKVNYQTWLYIVYFINMVEETSSRWRCTIVLKQLIFLHWVREFLDAKRQRMKTDENWLQPFCYTSLDGQPLSDCLCSFFFKQSHYQIIAFGEHKTDFKCIRRHWVLIVKYFVASSNAWPFFVAKTVIEWNSLKIKSQIHFWIR